MKQRKETSAYDSLYRHNKDVVSVEARATHIARAFLKGRSFSSIEGKLHSKYVGNTYCYTGSRYDNQQKAIKRAKTIMTTYHKGSRVDKETWETWLTT